MADRLTQLQDTVNQQAENFTNSLGILQQISIPATAGAADASSGTGSQALENGQNNVKSAQMQCEEHTNLFSQLIARTAKDIELLIESLPSEESSSELQALSLQQLEKKNDLASRHLEEVVRQGEAILKEIQSALHNIAQSQLDTQKLEQQ